MLARLARVLLVVALLAGWQAALVHPLQHFAHGGGFVHLDGDPKKQPEKSVLCDVIAALAACAAPDPLAFHVFSSSLSAPLMPQELWHAAEPPPFLAQGPPEHL